MDSSMHFLDGNYNLFGQMSTPSFAYESGFFEYDQMDAFFSEIGFHNPTLNSIYGYEHITGSSETCNPVDVMGPEIDFSDFLRDGWSDTTVPPNDRSEVPIAPDGLVPIRPVTPPISVVAIPAPLFPSTPKRPSLEVTAGVANTGLLSPPPSDRPARTRRHNAYDEICQLSNLGLNTPRPKKPSTEPTPVFTTPLPPVSCVLRTPATPTDYHDVGMPPSSCHSSSSNLSSSTFSPIESSSNIFGSPRSPPETPVRRPTRRSGVDRLRLSHKDSDEKRSLRPYTNPTPSGDCQRPHGCRHPGNIVPGDVPCSKNFARMHDWVRHQYVHTGYTPFRCLNCDKEFKRSDARGRHWDNKPICEAEHMDAIRQGLLLGQITADHPDVPILRRRAQKVEYQKESKGTGIPLQDLKDTMQRVKRENVVGPGF